MKYKGVITTRKGSVKKSPCFNNILTARSWIEKARSIYNVAFSDVDILTSTRIKTIYNV